MNSVVPTCIQRQDSAFINGLARDLRRGHRRVNWASCMNVSTEVSLQALTRLIQTNQLDPDRWVTFPEHGFRHYVLWQHPETGARIALLEVEQGGGFPVRHSHASNQFMYCIDGDYEYTHAHVRLRRGSFYMNPKDHPHGPTVAHTRSILLEMYDGLNAYETPVFHDDEFMQEFLNSA